MNSSNAASIIVSDPNLSAFITSEAPENLRADIWIETIAEKSDLLPYRVNATDAGADLRANHNFILRPGERKTVTTGVRVDIPAGFMGLIYGRSGLANAKGIDVLGGVIDAGFQGELSVVLVNTAARNGLLPAAIELPSF